MEEKHRRPGGTIYLSDGHLDLALIHSEKYPWGIHHFGFKVDSVKDIEKIADTKAEDNTYGAIAESWIKDVEGNRVDVSEHEVRHLDGLGQITEEPRFQAFLDVAGHDDHRVVQRRPAAR